MPCGDQHRRCSLDPAGAMKFSFGKKRGTVTHPHERAIGEVDTYNMQHWTMEGMRECPMALSFMVI